MLNDSIHTVSVSEFWEAVYEVTYDPEGNAIDSTMVEATGTVEITELSYYRRYPMWFEIMSFVTPYGSTMIRLFRSLENIMNECLEPLSREMAEHSE